MHSRTLYSLFCLLPCTGLGLLSPAAADTLTVCSSGCDYSDIESAIDAASDGDVIEIAAGTFGGYSYEEVGTLGKAITIRGAVDSAGEPLTSVICRLYISGGETSSTVFENLIVKYQW
ncbi:MAG: hypothetical protein GY826_29675, partial [Fuerstiella sp.]|nr:hypothetical protein [Fuerstiella sp.]